MTAATCAVVREPGGPFRLEQVELSGPRPDEVLVEVVASGMCHTDLLVRDSRPDSLPAVLGHEGAGVVREVGSEVRGLAAGDKVVLSFPSCGACVRCRTGRSAYCDSIAALKFRCARPDGSVATTDAQGSPVGDHFFGQSSFGTLAVAYARSVVKLPDDVDLTIAGPLACGVQTGAGTVLDVLRVPPGSSIAVFGAGSVGLCAVMAAKLCGATTIVAVNRRASRLALAAEFGATHLVSPLDADPVEAVREATGGRGVDFAFETTGVPAVLTQAVRSLDSLGTCAYVGTAAPGELGGIPMLEAMTKGLTVRGVLQGDSTPSRTIPRLWDLHQRGLLPYDRLITHYRLDEINQAAADTETGDVVKPVVLMPTA
ncbi:Aryl-alcohol dehydrogenase [Modestobacter italicus]|uniref:Aryl-alcohol dehydrogenase n=1 Tax=Modestobacter italicus (strain DSM 44449 / CECT 9708 / BC 501) TaxID=2732864 RepID=I4EWQ4_MODI5|nr:NAD(P)-dependent alcohol dehydrogenase [Modestobacter marinus]CCH87817.1 Aryl-alcohol dehydrogenase [Modestobacter marinus]